MKQVPPNSFPTNFNKTTSSSMSNSNLQEGHLFLSQAYGNCIPRSLCEYTSTAIYNMRMGPRGPMEKPHWYKTAQQNNIAEPRLSCSAVHERALSSNRERHKLHLLECGIIGKKRLATHVVQSIPMHKCEHRTSRPYGKCITATPRQINSFMELRDPMGCAHGSGTQTICTSRHRCQSLSVDPSGTSNLG